ncbi:1-phosphatidylinositol 3-phosphate 5-kinase [Trichoplax sp. H2]|nr:1-phosphatidylinositol 3-phosphate 5-kinase [Trichoplax sp. H2]|eukprot:RDD46412.1 1-phosphatidylinositol 3-phosphate 5-kinase [Trichoplax sp. H2]
MNTRSKSNYQSLELPPELEPKNRLALNSLWKSFIKATVGESETGNALSPHHGEGSETVEQNTNERNPSAAIESNSSNEIQVRSGRDALTAMLTERDTRSKNLSETLRFIHLCINQDYNKYKIPETDQIIVMPSYKHSSYVSIPKSKPLQLPEDQQSSRVGILPTSTNRLPSSLHINNDRTIELIHPTSLFVRIILESERTLVSKPSYDQIANKVKIEPASSRTRMPLSDDDKTTRSVIIQSMEDNKHDNTAIHQKLPSKVSSTPSAPKDVSKQHWMPDEKCTECYECGQKFTILRRRHHCRCCGRIFCSTCCRIRIQGSLLAFTFGIDADGMVRVCHHCKQQVDSQMNAKSISTSGIVTPEKLDSQLTDETVNLSARKASFHKNANTEDTAFLPLTATMIKSLLRSGFNDANDKNASDNVIAIRKLQHIASEMCRKIDLIANTSNNHNSSPSDTIISGYQISFWLLSHSHAIDRSQAASIGQALVTIGFLFSLTRESNEFTDTKDSRFVINEKYSLDESSLSNDPKKLTKEIQSKSFDCTFISDSSDTDESFSSSDAWDPDNSVTNLTDKKNQFLLSNIAPAQSNESNNEINVRETAPETKPSEGIINFKSTMGATNRTKRIALENMNMNEQFQKLRRESAVRIYDQLMASENLDSKWKEILLSITYEIVESVRPDVEKRDKMDIRQYVKVKKVPGGLPSNTRVIYGTACSKDIAHKHMKNRIENPTILLLNCALEFQRAQNKYCSLQSVTMQEEEYLQNVVKKITSWSPDLIIVEKTVSQLALQYLLQAGITLMRVMKSDVMLRIVRSCRGDVINSLEQVTRPRLGGCALFAVYSYNLPNGGVKTITQFEGCNPEFGCSVILRGDTNTELAKVKRVLRFMIYAYHHLKLESSLLIDYSVDCKSSSLWEVTTNNPSKSTDDIEKKSNDETKAVLENENESSIADDSITNDLLLNDKVVYAFNNVITSVSMFKTFHIPYILTHTGNNSPVRNYLIPNIYLSKYFYRDCRFPEEKQEEDKMDPDYLIKFAYRETHANNEHHSFKPSGTVLLPRHEFITDASILHSNESSLQKSLVCFRSYGGRIYSVWSPATQDGRNKSDSECVSFGQQKIDCLDIYRHQQITVLYSRTSKISSGTSKCVSHYIKCIDFYSGNDIPLGLFLQIHCFSNQRCFIDNCELSAKDHVEQYTHNNGTVSIFIQNIPEEETSGDELEDFITSWNFCKICKKVTPVIPLSPDSWAISFGKFLEFFFYANIKKHVGFTSACSHLLFRDHYHYFRLGNIVAFFEFTEIDVMQLCPPAMMIEIVIGSESIYRLEVEIAATVSRGKKFFASIYDKLTIFMKVMNKQIHKSIEDLKINRDKFKNRVKELEIAFELCKDSYKAKTNTWSPEFCYAAQDLVVDLQQNLNVTYQLWKERFEELINGLEKLPNNKTIKRKNENIRSSVKISQLSNYSNTDKDFRSRVNTLSTVKSAADFRDHVQSEKSFMTNETPYMVKSGPSKLSINLNRSLSLPDITKLESNDKCSNFKIASNGDLNDIVHSCSIECICCNPSQSIDVNENQETSPFTEDCVDFRPEIEFDFDKDSSDNSIPFTSQQLESSVQSSRKDNYDELDEKQTQSFDVNQSVEIKKGISANTIRLQMHLNPPVTVHQHFLSSTDEIISLVIYDNEPSTFIAYTLSSEDYRRKMVELLDIMRQNSENEVVSSYKPQESIEECIKDYVQVVEADGQSLDSFDDDASPSEYVNISKNSSSPTYNNAIAHYSTKGNKLNIEKNNSNEFKSIKPQSKERAADDRYASDNRNDDRSQGTEQDTTDSGNQWKHQNSSVRHIKLQFSSPRLRFSCAVYFAEHFRQLRKMVLPGGEEKYIRSLSHCFFWSASGGKSRSLFCKTYDDRFVLKEIKRREMKSFLEFGPDYFNYISKACKNKTPSVIAKIIGVYTIEFKNFLTNEQVKLDICVMENLFYRRNLSQIFDLKGSMRSRYVSTDRKETVVLLDKNFIEYTDKSPLYMRDHDKNVLLQAVVNDTALLERSYIMDYSLLVGIDKTNSQIVVGIIDYLRTYTWDKKIEFAVKSSGILGGQGEKPTVLSPAEYRARFCAAMDKYFLIVHNRWSHLVNGNIINS